MPTHFDLLYVALFALGLPLYDHVIGWPAFERRVQAQPAQARAWLWSTTIVQLWLLVAVAAGHWLYMARPWSALKFAAPAGWRLGMAIVLIAAYAAYQLYCVAQLRRDAALREQLRGAIGGLDKVLPHTRSEVRHFAAVSLTAGVCEEFLYRGYFVWTLAPWLGSWGAAALSVPFFAIAHAYQGWQGVVRTGIVGGGFTLLVVLLDSLWPAIVLHALVDVFAGVMAWLVLRDGGEGNDGAATTTTA